jgi:hypothetical protein
MRAVHRWIGWGGFALLLVLHLDFWRPQRVEIWFGWVPEELLYRLVWMGLAWIYLVYVCAVHWRDE